MTSLERIPVLFCTDENYWQHMGATIASLLSANPGRKFRIMVCSSSASPAAEQQIRAITPDVEFITFSLETASLRTDRHITVATYLRLFMTEYLDPSIDKLLYLDCDMIVCREIDELWNVDITDYPLAAVPEPYSGELSLGFKVGDAYFNAGTLLVNLTRWREEGVLPKFLEFAAEHKDRILAHDQDILNCVFRGRIKPLSYRWNFHTPYPDFSAKELRVTSAELAELRKNPGIVHFSGTVKPWLGTQEPHYKRLYWEALYNTPWRDYTPADSPSLATIARLKGMERINWLFPKTCAVLRSLLGRPGRASVTR